MSSDAAVNDITKATENVVLGEDGKPLSKNALKKLEKEREKEKKRLEREAREAEERRKREEASPDYSKDRYGKKQLNQSRTREGRKTTPIEKLDESLAGQTVLFRARLQTSRAKSAKMTFLVFRQSFSTVQGVLVVDQDTISKQMTKFAASIPVEALVWIEGKVVKPNEPVSGCTVSSVEIHLTHLFVESEPIGLLPFTLEDASRSGPEPSEEEEQEDDRKAGAVKLSLKLDNRVVDLRTLANQAIFRIQSGVCQLFREFLIKKDFMEIHTPKIISAASEGGANVFKISYFKTSAYLAQSPQLYKQMCIASDFNRVFEIAPVFRAEDSNTHRHATEFVGLDLEMAFEEHYHEVLDLFDELFVFLFTGLKDRFQRETQAVQSQFPFEEFKFLPKSLRLTFPEAVKMLKDGGFRKEDGEPLGDFEDMNTAAERFLGQLVKEKYGTDFFMLDKFPLNVRPFYTMPHPEDPNYSNSYDFFIRGEEILSGAQRIHDYDLLLKRAQEHEVDPTTIQGYLDAFKYGAPPHGGGGIGLERVVMLYLNLGNIRKAALFPRDPKRLTP